jgi:uncharacterized protein (TIRG00374 family)
MEGRVDWNLDATEIPVPSVKEAGERQSLRTKSILKKLYVILGITISLICLFLAFHNIQWTEVAFTLKRANHLKLSAAIFFQLLSLAIAGLRWKTVINLPGVSWASTSASMMVGLMVNNILPGRMGELVRSVLLAQEVKKSRSFLFATVVLDRLSDLLVLVILALASATIYSSFSWLRQMSMIGGAVLLLAFLLIGIFSYSTMGLRLEGMVQPFVPVRFYGKVVDILRKFRFGLQTIQSIRRGVAIFGLSWTVWGAWFLCLYYGLRAFELCPPLWGMILLLAVLNLGGLIPSSPGYAGTYHLLAILVLSNLGMRKEEALSFILVFHALWYIPQTLIGVTILIRKNLSLSNLLEGNGRAGQE